MTELDLLRVVRVVLFAATGRLRDQWAQVRQDGDRGDIVQTVIIVALFAAAALTIVGLLVGKATGWANKVRS